ncbi:hypothetical protein M9H77_16318 [Catharanthus roseus]|uniref:Uncharacterized protein n=1 Tax=Catharanthus roseus TaxID=4058 RepID=A0ACC0B1F9_CATRO|nr:hypothetical protein M9H77_16318 [Catharanthus roseus]
MQGRNTVEEVLCLSAKRGYTLNPFAHKFVRYWTKSHMFFGVETTNPVESEHLVLKFWLSTCHVDLDTMFLTIDSLIEGQIADIKASFEFSRTKEKLNAMSNHIFFILSDIEAFWKTLEIGGRHPSARRQNMDSEVAITKGRKKTNSTKRDKSHWEHVSIAHRKIQKSSESGSTSSSGSGLWLGSSSRITTLYSATDARWVSDTSFTSSMDSSSYRTIQQVIKFVSGEDFRSEHEGC